MWSNTPVYVAGFDRGVRPIGDWSMSITLSICSHPTSCLCFPGRSRERYTFCISARSRTSCTSVDLPEPLTPVTQTKSPSGISTIDVLQVVLARAEHRSRRSPGARRTCGVGITRRPERNAPVSDASHSSNPFRSPE